MNNTALGAKNTKKQEIVFISAYSAKTEHSLRMSGALFR